jgi:hypothetical protein
MNLALKGGYYNWNTVPISDGDPERGDVFCDPPRLGRIRFIPELGEQITLVVT